MEPTHRAPAAPCSRCERLPEPSGGHGRLYLWFPLGHTMGKILPYLKGIEGAYDLLWHDHCVILTLDAHTRDHVITALSERLGPEEQHDTKALFLRHAGEPTLSDYANVMPLTQFLKVQSADWLIALLAEGRFTTYMQPIFHAHSPEVPFAHEALFRGLASDGSLIPPGRIFDLARDTGLLFQLDLQARKSAIRQMASYRLTTPLFINFNPASIYDPAFCLRSTLATIDELRVPRDQVVFEVVESDRIERQEHLARILDHYREQGFRVALDDLGAGFSSLNLLSALRPDFVKIDMGLVRGVDGDPYRAAITGKLLELASELGVQTIAEGVETPSELAWLQAHGATYVQGYLLGRPSPEPVRPQVQNLSLPTTGSS